LQNDSEKIIYEYADIKGEPHAIRANNINPYLVDAPETLIQKQTKPIGCAPELIYGNEPREGGNLIFDDNEKNRILDLEPNLVSFIRPFVGAEDFINNISRWFFWLKNVTPQQLRSSKILSERIAKVRDFRKSSLQKQANAAQNTPALFVSIRQPKTDYLLIPIHSSENRKFIPIGYMSSDKITSNANFALPQATLFHFGMLTSTMHMAWVRTVCGRLKSDFRYSAGIVYNNFPWPEVNLSQVAKIEAAAQAVLDARAVHTNASLAVLYDPLTMPANLLKAHQVLDKAVDATYGYKGAATDAARVAFLFERYQQITSLLPAVATKTKKVTKKLSS
jgi:hypothetical protein